jgi:hypothetical protein
VEINPDKSDLIVYNTKDVKFGDKKIEKSEKKWKKYCGYRREIKIRQRHNLWSVGSRITSKKGIFTDNCAKPVESICVAKNDIWSRNYAHD